MEGYSGCIVLILLVAGSRWPPQAEPGELAPYKGVGRPPGPQQPLWKPPLGRGALGAAVTRAMRGEGSVGGGVAFHRGSWSTSGDASGREPGSPVPSALLLYPWAECAGTWDQPPAFCRLAWELTAVGFMVSWGLGSAAEKPRPPMGLWVSGPLCTGRFLLSRGCRWAPWCAG